MKISNISPTDLWRCNFRSSWTHYRLLYIYKDNNSSCWFRKKILGTFWQVERIHFEIYYLHFNKEKEMKRYLTFKELQSNAPENNLCVNAPKHGLSLKLVNLKFKFQEIFIFFVDWLKFHLRHNFLPAIPFHTRRDY